MAAGETRPLFFFPALLVPPLASIFAGYGLHEMEPRMSMSQHMATFALGILAGAIFFWLALPKILVIEKLAITLFYLAAMAILSFVVGYSFVSARYQIAL